MTRLFREGRTETVRSCTAESCAFVRSMIRDETVRPNSSRQSTRRAFEFVLTLAFLASSGPIRQKNVWGCWKRQQKSTKICTAWRWRDRASTATSSVCMWSPNTWEKTRPSSRRCDGWLLLPNTPKWTQHLIIMNKWCVSGAVWALEAVHQSDSSAAGGAVWPGQTPRVRVFRRWFWSGRYSFRLGDGFSWVRLWRRSDFWALPLCAGGRWWLRRLLHHRGRESDQLPHLQQTLQSRNCKFSVKSRMFSLFFFFSGCRWNL